MAITIKILRFSAKLLVFVTPVMVLTGLLTAKPYLWEAIDFATARALHTAAVPFLFLPLVAIHSVAGLLFLLARSKTYNRPVIRRTVLVVWPGLFLGLGLLSFASPPSALPRLPPSPRATVDGGADSGAHGGVAAPGDSGTDVGDGSAVDTGFDGQGGVGAEPGANPTAEVAASPRDHVQRKNASSPRRLRRQRRRSRQVPVTPAKQRMDETVEVSTSRPVPVEAGVPPRESAASPVEPASPSVVAGATLVRERCGGCHPLSVVYEGPPRTAATWREVVTRMQQMGAQLTATEAQVVIRHVASR